ncbi:histidine-rich glycoprotein-like isoform X4 [Brienomyrus brachyistius]|uniref:histidine-rich glycoprotein-like isoform X4 n=1 Tax=Brienomyrus brachyistius TaxID=42636 RepID=UPI0020B347E5|nr:histidine-rich glycoprotein-like isoform X4 [Brienomyrus brachyistius]
MRPGMHTAQTQWITVCGGGTMRPGMHTAQTQWITVCGGGTMQPGMHTAQTQWITVCRGAPCSRACTQHKHSGLQYAGWHHAAGHAHNTNTMDYSMWGGHHAAGHAHNTNTMDYSMQGGTMRPGMHTAQTQWITVCGVAPCGRACTQHKHNGLQYAGWHHAAGHAHNTNTMDYSMRGGTMRPGMHTAQTQWITVCRGAPCGRACTQHKHNGLQYAGGHHAAGHAHSTNTVDYSMWGGHHAAGHAHSANTMDYSMWGGHHAAGHAHSANTMDYSMWGGHHAAGHAHSTNTVDYSMQGGTMRPGMHTTQTQWITVCGVAPCGRACTQHKHSGLQYAGWHHAAGHAHSTNTVDYSMRGGTMRPGMHTAQTQWITVCGGGTMRPGMHTAQTQWITVCGGGTMQLGMHKHNG